MHVTPKRGSLHETEFIAPHTREGETVYLVGYIFESDTIKLDEQKLFSQLAEDIRETATWR